MTERPICATRQELRSKLIHDLKLIPTIKYAVKTHGTLTFEDYADELLEMAFKTAEFHDVDDGRETMIYVNSYVNGYMNCIIEQDVARALLMEKMIDDENGKIPPPTGREC